MFYFRCIFTIYLILFYVNGSVGFTKKTLFLHDFYVMRPLFWVVDKTLTPSPWTTLMDYPHGLPKWTTLKRTNPKNTISDYILTLHDLRGLQPPF